MDENWHDIGTESQLGYEWFYFDVITPEGTAVTVVFLGPNPFDPRLAAHAFLDPREHVGVMVQIIHEGKQEEVLDYRHGSDHLVFQERDPYLLAVGESWFRRIDRRFEVHLDVDSVRVDLVFESELPPWQPGDGRLFACDAGYHRWVVSSPRARVKGNVEIRGKTVQVEGFGYHDHNWGTLPLSAALEGWIWLRGHTAKHTVVAAKMFSNGMYRDAEPFIKGLVYVGGADGVVESTEARVELEGHGIGDNGLSFPTGISVSVGGLQVEFQHREVIFDAMGPFYLRRKGVLRIGKEKGEAIVEDMHAAKFAGWYLKSAAATAAEDVGVDRTFLQDAANALRTSARIQAKIIRRIGDRTRRRVARRELLDVAGKIGGTADFHLEVSNSEESSVELTTSYFVEDAEGQRLPVRLSMEPRRADLKPDGSVTLQGRIDLDPTVFRAGLVYFGELEVRGGRDVLREVDLEIRPAD